MDIILEIYTNKIVLIGESGSATSLAEKPFSTTRLLVGDFEEADKCLQDAAKKLGILGVFKRKPSVVVKPKEIIDGGISQVEDRVFRELALCIGAKKVDIAV